MNTSLKGGIEMTNRPKLTMLLGLMGAFLVVTLSACSSASTSAPNDPGSGSGGGSSQSSGSGSSGEASTAAGGSGAVTSSSADTGSGSGSGSSNGNSGGSASASPGSGSTLPAAGYFELDLPFTEFESSNAVTEQEEENAFQHVLFYVDPSGGSQSQVIDGNLSSSPVPATVTPQSDGTVTVAYSEQTSSTTIDFTGTLSGSTMTATVNVSQIGGDVVEGTEYLGAGTGTVNITAPINRVSGAEIPQPPSGGSCGYSNDYGVELSWTPPSGGASAYDLFAVLNTSAVDVVYQGRVTTSGADDESEIAKANDGGTMSYEIYSVSSNGLESLTPLYVTLTGLPGATAPICSYSG
jgi:hypothetical protein